MPYYLMQGTFSPEARAAMARDPQDRAEAVRTTVEKLGGRLVSYYYAFGEADTAVTLELPDQVTAVAVALAFSASGGFQALKTTPLLTAEEGMEALRKASQVGGTYQSPLGKGGTS